MDFVVVGLGLGALAVLAGLLLRDRASRRSPGTGAASASATRTFHRAGTLLIAAGALLGLVTVGAVALGRDDRVGTIVVLAVLAIEVAIGIGWAARAVPRRPRTRVPVAAADPAESPRSALPAQPLLGGSRDGGGSPAHTATTWPDPSAVRVHGDAAGSVVVEGGLVDADQSGDLGQAVDVAPAPAFDGGFQDGSDGDSGSGTGTAEEVGEDLPGASSAAGAGIDAEPGTVDDPTNDAASQDRPMPPVEATRRVGIDAGIAAADIPDAASSPRIDASEAFAVDAQPDGGSDEGSRPGDAPVADGDAEVAPPRSRPDGKAGV